MKFTVSRDQLLKPLQALSSVVERRQTMPILSHLLFALQGNQLTLVATDLEIEMTARLEVILATTDNAEHSEIKITASAKKLLDIIKNLPEKSSLNFEVKDDHKLVLSCGRSRFVLSSLVPNEFPLLECSNDSKEERLAITPEELKYLLEQVGFAMAQQDVRHYLNGLLLEIKDQRVTSVATDGHRLALTEIILPTAYPQHKKLILPRKAVHELIRLLGHSENIELLLRENYMQILSSDFCLSVKLIQGNFPDYQNVVPSAGENEKVLIIDRDMLKQALLRVVTLSNEKYKSVRFSIEQNSLKITTSNPEHEEAEDCLEVDYCKDPLEVGFNSDYLQDILAVLKPGLIRIMMKDTASSVLLQDSSETSGLYVIMPMRL